MSDGGPARTMFAAKAIEMHTLFAVRFKDTRVGSKVPRRVLVQEIDVETTGGGKQAKMNIALVPEGGGPSLVCGWLDAANNRVRLRSFATVTKIFKAQAKHFFDLPEAEYQHFVDEAREFVTSNGFAFDVYDEDSRYGKNHPEVSSPASASPSRIWALVGAAVIAAVAVGLVLKLLMP
ncbi:MAG: hypothetical protein ABIJ09_22300 [Pseudomonadota bacterium]